MKLCLKMLAATVMAALPLSAQQTPAAATAPLTSNVVATVNGEQITAAHLDLLWNRVGAKMRAQYDKSSNGNGKLRFLENYIGKRLLLQLAAQSDFDKSPAVQAELDAAREAALFDAYVRDVVASQIVTEPMMRKFYEENMAEFAHGETVKARVIQVSKEKHTEAGARQLLSTIMRDLFTARISSGNNHQVFYAAFSEAAKKHSDHPSAANGGDLGWLEREQLDPELRMPVWAMKPANMSGILDTEKAMYLVLVEEHLPSWVDSYESAKPTVREFLLTANQQKVVEAVSRATRELRTTSQVTVYPDNIR